MILYGTKPAKLVQEIIPDMCPNCNNQHCVEYAVFQKYAHVYWIPFFPMSKTTVSQCTRCNQVLNKNEMPSYWKMTLENMKVKTKTPVWTFAGVALLAAILAIVMVTEVQKDQKNATLVVNPKIGDILNVRTQDKQYTLLKVEEIHGDSVIIRPNNFETNLATGLPDIKKKGDQAYSDELIGIEKSELKKMFDKGDIINIDRR